MNPRVQQLTNLPIYKLKLRFENGETGIFDFSKYLNYPIYEPLLDEAYCKKARVFNGTVSWDDVVDFDPDALYVESDRKN